LLQTITDGVTILSEMPAPTKIRLDPAPTKVFSWIEFDPDGPQVLDDRGRTIQPAGPCLNIRYRYNGAEWSFYPVSEDEARAVMNPTAKYGFSIGSAFSSVIKAHKSGRAVKIGDRQATVKQREEIEKREGRRWLA